MSSLILAFFVSFIANIIVVITKDTHLRWTTDDLGKAHNLNRAPIPRIGGLGIFIGAIIVVIYEYIRPNSNWYPLSLLLISVSPIFFLGCIEDIFKNISPKIRLAGSFIAGIIFIILFEADNQYIIKEFKSEYVIYATSVLFIAILINSYNLIDGLNGLSSMVGIISLLSLCYLGYRVNDWMIIHISLVIIAAIMGFFIINYPMGNIFLGDSGAYLIGFFVASTSLLILGRNPDTSIWGILLINIYPLFETIFTILRRMIAGENPMVADKIHLHSLVLRRLKNVKWFKNQNNHYNITPIMWILSCLGAIPAALFWNNEAALKFFLVIYIFIYSGLYIILKNNWIFKK